MDDSIRKIEICRDQLLEAIRTSSVCRNYEEKAAALDQYPDRRARTDDFRRRSFESQGGLSEGDDMESRHRLFREKQELYADPVIGDYLSSELEFQRTGNVPFAAESVPVHYQCYGFRCGNAFWR